VSQNAQTIMSKYNLHFVEPVNAGLFLLRAGLISAMAR
jgi:hypothetical protein